MVVRVNVNNEIVDSKPCAMCVKMMKDYRIKKVYYSVNGGTIETQKVADMVPEHISHGTIQSMEQMTQLNQFIIFGMIIKKTDINRETKTLIFNDKG